MAMIKPRNGLLIIRVIPNDAEIKTKAGIVLPRGQRGHIFEMAEIVAVGRGVLLDAGGHGGTDDLKPGMKVLVKTGVRQDIGQEAFSMLSFEVPGGGKISLCNQLDVLAIVDPEEVPAPALKLTTETQDMCDFKG